MSDWLLLQGRRRTRLELVFFGGATGRSVDDVPRSKVFPHVLLHAAFQPGNTGLVLILAVFTVRSPAVGVQPRSSSAWAPNASPSAAINQ